MGAICELGCTTITACKRRPWCHPASLMHKTADQRQAEYIARLQEALLPLVKIADEYDANNLDPPARKTWGSHDQFVDAMPAATKELYTGRGGKRLLTLADCFRARDAYHMRLTVKDDGDGTPEA